MENLQAIVNWLVDNYDWLADVTILAAVVGLYQLVLTVRSESRATASEHRDERRVDREDRDSLRAEREAIAPHVEAFWKAANALWRDYAGRCSLPTHPSGVPTRLLDGLEVAERAIRARTLNPAIVDAVSAYATHLRVIAMASETRDGRQRLVYPGKAVFMQHGELRMEAEQVTLGAGDPIRYVPVLHDPES